MKNFVCYIFLLIIFAASPSITLSKDFKEEDCLRFNKNGGAAPDYEIKVCTEAVQSWKRKDLNQASGYFILAKAWSQKGEYEKSIAASNQALKLDPNRADILLARGDAWLGFKNYKNAVRDYSDVLTQEPENYIAYTKRGSAFGLMGNLDNSISDSTRAIDIATETYNSNLFNNALIGIYNPERARALYNRGMAWKLKGEYIQAIEDYNNAVQSNPGDPHSWRKLPSNWDNRADAFKANVLFKDISFSNEMNTSDRRISIIFDVHETRFGNLLAYSDYLAPHATAIMLNGKKVFDAGAEYVSMSNYDQTGKSDYITLSTNAGGSQTPDVNVFYLIINSITETHIVNDYSEFYGKIN